jgi:hypothetical protein
MAAAAIAVIRKKLAAGNDQLDQKQDLLGRLPPRESRELDVELGMLQLG